MTKSDYENLLKRIEKNISNTSSSGKRFELPPIDKHKITHFGEAPIVLNMITGASASDQKKIRS